MQMATVFFSARTFVRLFTEHKSSMKSISQSNSIIYYLHFATVRTNMLSTTSPFTSSFFSNTTVIIIFATIKSVVYNCGYDSRFYLNFNFSDRLVQDEIWLMDVVHFFTVPFLFFSFGFFFFLSLSCSLSFLKFFDFGKYH